MHEAITKASEKSETVISKERLVENLVEFVTNLKSYKVVINKVKGNNDISFYFLLLPTEFLGQKLNLITEFLTIYAM